MSNTIGESNGSDAGSAVLEADGGEAQGQEQTKSHADIFKEEVEAIKAREEQRSNNSALRTRDTVRVPYAGDRVDASGDNPTGEAGDNPTGEAGDNPTGEAGDNQDPQLSDGGDEPQEEAEGSESAQPEDTDSNKKQRNDWKKEALESRQTLESLKAELAEIKQALNSKPADNKEPAQSNTSDEPTKPEGELPKVDISKMELSQEVKDLLEYTPGLDTLVTSLAVEAAKAIVETKEADRLKREQEQAQAREQEQVDQKYWSSMNDWIAGEYPELSLSDIRNSPEFNDWVSYHQGWVDTQLRSSAYDDISGAKKVFDRYIKEFNLAKPEPEPEPDRRNLSAVRRPPASRSNSPAQTNPGSLFAQEAQRLTNHRHRTTI